jgi:hypothetical protein
LVPDRQHAQLVAVHGDPVLGRLHGVRQRAEHRVELQQVSHRVERAEVVHGYEVDVRTGLLGGPEEVAADAAEAVDAHTDGHREQGPFKVAN